MVSKVTIGIIALSLCLATTAGADECKTAVYTDGVVCVTCSLNEVYCVVPSPATVLEWADDALNMVCAMPCITGTRDSRLRQFKLMTPTLDSRGIQELERYLVAILSHERVAVSQPPQQEQPAPPPPKAPPTPKTQPSPDVYTYRGVGLKINVPLSSIPACQRMNVPLFGNQRVPMKDRFCWASTETLKAVTLGTATIPPNSIELCPPGGYGDDLGAIYGTVHNNILVRVELVVFDDIGKDLRRARKPTTKNGNVEEWVTPYGHVKWTAIHTTPIPQPSQSRCFNTDTGEEVNPFNCEGVAGGFARATTAAALLKVWMVPNLLFETLEYYEMTKK